MCVFATIIPVLLNEQKAKKAKMQKGQISVKYGMEVASKSAAEVLRVFCNSLAKVPKKENNSYCNAGGAGGAGG
jgi:hypothetical protein